ncbi:hypothetical protein C5167_005966 [Papaver somniferum]|uniref:Uncharacterized protein n=1 Tax=Papaver somniferum TaxID=3469 RepID=A0A4Y7JDQ0_PAPSO|nr:hypothetical protein C5167_005966 [Papaver somniferum]
MLICQVRRQHCISPKCLKGCTRFVCFKGIVSGYVGYIKDLVIITPALPYKSRFIIRAIDTHRLYMNLFSPFCVSFSAGKIIWFYCENCSIRVLPLGDPPDLSENDYSTARRPTHAHLTTITLQKMVIDGQCKMSAAT